MRIYMYVYKYACVDLVMTKPKASTLYRCIYLHILKQEIDARWKKKIVNVSFTNGSQGQRQ